MATAVPAALAGLLLVLRHAQAATVSAERVRSHFLLGALCAAVGFMLTDLAAGVGWRSPRLAFFGTLLLSAALTALTLGLGFVKTRRRAALAEAVALALFALTTYLVLFAAFRDSGGLLLTALTGLGVAAAAVARMVWVSKVRQHEGIERFATLGRFSGQMAHDVKNPLAAAKGAAQYLETELASKGLAETREFAGLLVQQLDRVTAVIDRYQRLSHWEPTLVLGDLDTVVESVLRLQPFAAGERVAVHRTGGGAGLVSLDRDLLSSALENVLKNAFEALPVSGGAVTVNTWRNETFATITVTDTGQGMDARALEQAFTLFFTTKATGSGLGLPFVRQVLEAHGGAVSLDSVHGRGTTVRLMLPHENQKA